MPCNPKCIKHSGFCIKALVTNALKKTKLGQYTVMWKNNKVVYKGDAQSESKKIGSKL